MVLLEEKARDDLTHAAADTELHWHLARAREHAVEALREIEEAKERLRLEETAATDFRDALHSA